MFPVIYAALIAWASIGSYLKMICKDTPQIRRAAKKSFIRITASGLVGLVTLIILNNYVKDSYLDFHLFSNLNQMILLSVSIASVVVFLIFWNDSPSRSLQKQYQNKNQNRQKFDQELAETGFEPSKKVECNSEFSFYIDINKKMIAICNYLYDKKIVLNFSEILNCEILENNNVMFIGDSKTFNKVKCLKLRIITNDVLNAMRTVDLIRDETSKDSQYYKTVMQFAQEVYSAIFSLTSEKNKAEFKNHAAYETCSALEKLAELKDKNIITEEEFGAKKEKLLKKI